MKRRTLLQTGAGAALAPLMALTSARAAAISSPDRREELYQLLGKLPPRDRTVSAKLITTEDRDSYVLEKLVLDPGIIRHRGKILAVRENAKAWLALREREGDPVAWLWSFAGGKPKVNRFKTMADFPAKTAESDALSKALRKAGFNFVGSTTLYAFMQAVGMVNDHTVDCFRKTHCG